MYRVESFIFGLQQTPPPLHRPFAVCVSSPQPITHNTFQTCFPALYSSSLYSPDHPFSDVLRPIRVHHEHKMSSTQSEWQPRQNHSPLFPTPTPTPETHILHAAHAVIFFISINAVSLEHPLRSIERLVSKFRRVQRS